MHASLHLRISQHQPVAQQKLYVRFISTSGSVGLSVALICKPETRTMCTSLDQAVHICKLDAGTEAGE